MPSRQVLLSLPPAMAARFHELEGRDRADYFASFDEGGPLGSGGGIAGLLAEAWRANAGSHPFEEWLCERPRLAILSGGQSRRLPSYACVGKVLAPMPYQAADGPAAPGHNLLDRILASLKPLLDRLPSSYPLVVASGDALTIFRDLPELPNVDALGFGFDAGVATAGRHGTFFLPRGTRDLDFFLQKPAPERIRELDPTHQYLVDTGVWAFSARAAMALMGECGWSGERFLDGRPRRYELYTDFATALGLNPCRRHESVSELSAAVLPAGGAFHHFGTSRQLIDFTNRLSGSEEAIVQNATRLVKGDAVWVENSDLPADPFLEGENVLTNLPDPNWLPRLSKGVCLDFVPVGKEDWCLRFYGFDDPFAGEPSQASLLGRPVLDWFRKRGLESWEGDLQEAPLFPVLPADRISHEFIAWLTAAEPEGDHASMWRVTRRLSAQDLLREAEVGRIYSQRRELRTRFLKSLLRDRPREALRHIDLEALAATGVEVEVQERLDPLLSIRVPMLKSAAMRRRGDPGWEEAEAESFRILRELILRRERFAVEPPRDTLLKDQIVWGRSPLRMDLAGGWTDTPPYCMLYGGRVMNVAVELNGQPPVQVFGRVIDELVIVLRSLDVGTEKRISTYEELEGSLAVGSEFALAQAALVLSGFSREFCPGAETSLERQLARFGGGLEINVLAAVPKGSGLGTSSILSAAILGALGSICGHGWDEQAVF
ncbi:MAG TPA: L-fucokinase, partial [Fimbriimonas sp.]